MASYMLPSSLSSQVAGLENSSYLTRNSLGCRTARRFQPLSACEDESIHFNYSSPCRNTCQCLCVSDGHDDRPPRTRPRDYHQSAMFGLGLVLPVSVSLPLGSKCYEVIDVDEKTNCQNVSDFKSPSRDIRLSELEISLKTTDKVPQTPILCPVDFQDEVSPILPLPPSVDVIHSVLETTCRSKIFSELVDELLPANNYCRPGNNRRSTADYLLHEIPSLGPLVSQDITHEFLGSETWIDELTDVTPSPVAGTPTADIADQKLLADCMTNGSLTLSGFDNEPVKYGNGYVPHDNGTVNMDGKNPISLPLSNGSSSTQPYAMPLCRGQPRNGLLGLCLLSDGAGWNAHARARVRHATFRSSVMMRDPVAVRAHKRNGISNQPIEVSSPSMTPSPTSSPKFCVVAALQKDGEYKGDRCTQEWSTSNLIAGRYRSPTFCTRSTTDWSNKEGSRKPARRGPWHSPTTRSPVSLEHPVGVHPRPVGHSGIGETAPYPGTKNMRRGPCAF